MRLLPLVLLLALSACATPQERCINSAAKPYRDALQERERIAQDLARGFTFVTKFERRTRRAWCKAPNGGAYPCWDTDTQPVTRRVPINAEALRTRDAQLARDIPDLRAASEAEARQCIAALPEPA